MAIAALSVASATSIWLTLPSGIRPAALTAEAWLRVLRSPVLMGIVSVTALQGAGQFVLFSYFGPILKQSFGDRYIYAGLGTTVLLGPKITVKAEAGQPTRSAMDEEDLRGYREALTRRPVHARSGGGERLARQP